MRSARVHPENAVARAVDRCEPLEDVLLVITVPVLVRAGREVDAQAVDEVPDRVVEEEDARNQTNRLVLEAALSVTQPLPPAFFRQRAPPRAPPPHAEPLRAAAAASRCAFA